MYMEESENGTSEFKYMPEMFLAEDFIRTFTVEKWPEGQTISRLEWGRVSETNYRMYF